MPKYDVLIRLCLASTLYTSSYLLSTAAISCSPSLFIVKPGEKEIVYAPSGQNETFSCTVNGSDLSWEFDGFNLQVPHLADEHEEEGIFFTPPLNTGQLLSSTLTVFVSDYSNGADICCQGRRTGGNRLENCCRRIIKFGRPQKPFLEEPHYLREAGSVNLSWTANITQGVEHNYTIIIRNVTSTSHNVLMESVTSLHYIILDKCGEFSVQVIAVNRAGESDPSNTVRVSLPLLPDIKRVSESLQHRQWKVDGQIMLLITFDNAYFCAEHKVILYCVQMNTVLLKCVDGNETEVHLGLEKRITDNTFYEYTISAINKFGVRTSAIKNLTTSDIESVTVEVITDDLLEVTCYFINGSDARGCMVVMVSEHTSLPNITSVLIKTNTSDTVNVVTQSLSIHSNIACYHHVYSFDIEANNTTSSLPINGNILTNGTNECNDSEGKISAHTWTIVSVVLVLLTGVITASLVIIVLIVKVCTKKQSNSATHDTVEVQENHENIVTTPSDAYGVITRLHCT